MLRKFSPRGLKYQEIVREASPEENRYLNVGKSLYTVLDRLEDRQLITKRRSRTDARRWVYCLPDYTTGKEVEVSQHLVNTHSTLIQQPENVDLAEKTQSIDEKKNTETQAIYSTHY